MGQPCEVTPRKGRGERGEGRKERGEGRGEKGEGRGERGERRGERERGEGQREVLCDSQLSWGKDTTYRPRAWEIGCSNDIAR